MNRVLLEQFLNELAFNFDYATTENKQIIVTGDFNIDFSKMGEREKLCTVITPYGLHVQNNKEPTKTSNDSKSQTLIDYLICEPSLFKKVLACDTNLKSDHFGVLGIFNCYAKTKQPRLIKYIHDKSNYKKSSYQESVRDLNWSLLYNNSFNPSLMVEVLDYILAQVLNHHAPLKKCYIRNNKNSFQLADKWLTRKTKSLKISRDKFLNDENYETFFKLKQDVLKSETNDFNKFYSDLIEAAATDRQKWQLINEIRNQRKTQTDIKCLRNVFGDYITETMKMANLLTFQFSQLGQFKGPKFYWGFSEKNSPSKRTFSFRFVTDKECHDALRHLKVSKPQGPSLIPAWALKDAASELVPHLSFIINQSVKELSFPKSLKKAIVIPLFKKGDTEDPDNYRPISLTPCISKIFETLLRDQIVDYLWSEKLITKTQYGFRKRFSTTDAITYCTEFIQSETDKNKYVSAALLDLSKAFDSINHKNLDEKLDMLGFNTSSRLLIKNFLSDREQQVKIQNRIQLNSQEEFLKERSLVHCCLIYT